MKKFLWVIIILGIIGFIGYRFIWAPQKAKNNQTAQPAVKPAPVEEPASDGITLFKKERYSDAITQLQKEIKQKKGEDITRHLYYIALAYKRINKMDQVDETWQRITRESTKNAYIPDNEICLELGEAFLTGNLPDKEYKARRCFSVALKSNLTKEKAKQIKQTLAELNKKLIFSKMPTVDSDIYIIKSGDTLSSIANKYKVEVGGDIALGHIRRVNQMKTDRIYPEDKVKIITGKFHIEVNKTDMTLTLYVNDDFVKEYQVATGKPGSDTPTGLFHIVGKVVNPPWTFRYEDGRSEIIPFGDTRNVLGTRWMGFKESPRLGVHGTTIPESIGKKATDGCIRLRNDEVEELYDLIPENTEVFIIE
jgi:lipoprotein-anchoring transpeptidase ErfK/SrfK